MFDRIKDLLARRRRDADGAHLMMRRIGIGSMVESGTRADHKTMRDLMLAGAKLAATPGRLAEAVAGISAVADANEAETSSWLTADEVREGRSGRFEATSLLSWLAVAEAARAASGRAPHFTGAIPDRIRAKIRAELERDAQAFAHAPSEEAHDAPVDLEDLVERMHAVMDDLPADTMVRTDQIGAGTLKVLACSGLVDDVAPEVGFGPGLEIGPGWVRSGNRRRVDASDRRIVSAYAQGPCRGMTFVARPWIKTARHIEGRDPHRAGTPFDQPGLWPAEWRAFVRGGVVEGVSAYYTWLETPSPLTAAKAIEVRALAQRIVDRAIAQGLEPRTGAVEMARRQNPQLAAALDEQGFADGSFSATLDFIEGPDGLLLLEAGPGHTPAGGGHPCAFAGTRGPLRMGNAMETVGVAFRTMAHIDIMDPSSWTDGDRSDAILRWDEVEALAQA